MLACVDADQVILWSTSGVPADWAGSADRAALDAVCRSAAGRTEPLLVGDLQGSRFLPTGLDAQRLELRSCAAVPLLIERREAVGCLCVMDRRPRTWSSRDSDRLVDLAGIVEGELAQQVEQQRVETRPADAHRRIDGLLLKAPMFRQLVEQSLVGIALVQGDEFRYVNPRFAEIFGYTVEELMAPLPIAHVIAEQDRPLVAENLRLRLSGEVESIRYSFHGLRRDGSIIVVEAHGTRTELDGRPAVISTLLDVTERQRREDELRQREEHFRSLIENAWDVIQVVDARDVIRYISPSVTRVLGYDPEEMVGRRAAEFLHAEDAAASRRAFEHAIERTGVVLPLELRLRHRDQTWRAVEFRGKTIRGPVDEVLVILNWRDVTERRLTERALKESEERYRLVIHATSSAIWDWDLESGDIVWNGDSHLMLRYSPDELKPRIAWWFERVHPEDRPRVVSSLHAALNGMGDAWSAEHRFLRGDGVYATVLDCCYISRDRRGNALRVIGSLQDVTQRKAAEEAQRFLARAGTLLDESLDHVAALVRLARIAVPSVADYCAIDLIDQDGVLRRAAAAHADPGKESSLLLRPTPPSLTELDRDRDVRAARSREPVLIPECTDALLESISEGQDQLAELRDVAARSLMIVPLVAHGQLLGMMTLAASESERRYTPLDLILALDLAYRAALAVEHGLLYRQAQEAIRARDEILGVVSHDLRNPLNLVQLSADMLLSATEQRVSSDDRPLRIIKRAVGQMDRMIGDLLDLSTIEAKRFTIDAREHDGAALLAEAEALLRPLAEARSIDLSCTAGVHLPRIRMDADQILRVLSNLGGNAIKFTPEGGAVTLRVERDGEKLRFVVCDTGPGIPAEELPHVFDRYWQARKGDRRGVGLGLAIARGIVEAHGGRIDVESSAGGARFSFTIPDAGTELPPAAP